MGARRLLARCRFPGEGGEEKRKEEKSCLIQLPANKGRPGALCSPLSPHNGRPSAPGSAANVFLPVRGCRSLPRPCPRPALPAAAPAAALRGRLRPSACGGERRGRAAGARDGHCTPYGGASRPACSLPGCLQNGENCSLPFVCDKQLVNVSIAPWTCKAI